MHSTDSILDVDARLAAVAVERSVIVQAPAGSGKTTLLVERFLNLLGVVDRPEEILAITFTRKAAAEMLERVIGSLQVDCERSRAIHARSRALGWQLDSQPGRLRIQTIDAFCVGLVQRLPISSGLADRLRIVEDPDAFYREAIDRTFDRLARDDALNAELTGVLAMFDNDYEKARASMSTMLAKRDQWLGVIALTLRAGRADLDALDNDEAPRAAIAAAIETGIRSLHEAAFSDIEADLSSDQRRELAIVATEAARRLGVEWPAAGFPTQLPHWYFIANLVATRNGQPRSRLGKEQGFVDASVANQSAKARLKMLIEDLAAHGLIDLISSLRLLPHAALDPREVGEIVNVATGLAVAAAELDGIFRRNRVIDFAELNFAALRAFGEPESPTDLALALDYRIKHLLIDEFQDTSAIQFRLVERVTQEWQDDEARSLFVVGDPMQSIYRFRDADVALFQRARRNGIANLHPASLNLSANFRSSEALVNWCNAIFAGSLGDVEDPVLGRVSFSPSAPVHGTVPGDGCRVYGIVSSDGDRAEAVALAQTVEMLRNDYPDQSIAILVRNRTHLAQVLPTLTARNIPWTGTDIHALSDEPIISDLMSLLKAISSEGNRIAWLALLRAPFVGMSLHDLEVIAQFDDTIARTVQTGVHDQELSDDGRLRLQRIRPTLLRAARNRGQSPVRQWLENTFIRLGGADAYDSADAIPHAQRLLAQIEESHPRTVDIPMLERSVQRLFAESSIRHDGIVVMTIHRAKGLEFDHVILPGMHRVSRLDDPPTILWRPEADRLLLGVRNSAEGGVYRWLSHEERHREANERTRLLYVAATRARRSLHLFGVLEEEEGELRPPPSRSLFAPIWPLTRDQTEIIRPPASQAEPLLVAHARRVLPADYVWQPPAAEPMSIDQA